MSHLVTKNASHTLLFVAPALIYTCTGILLTFTTIINSQLEPLLEPFFFSLIIIAAVMGIALPIKKAHNEGCPISIQILKGALGLLGQVALLLTAHIIFIIIMHNAYGGIC